MSSTARSKNVTWDSSRSNHDVIIIMTLASSIFLAGTKSFVGWTRMRRTWKKNCNRATLNAAKCESLRLPSLDWGFARTSETSIAAPYGKPFMSGWTNFLRILMTHPTTTVWRIWKPFAVASYPTQNWTSKFIEKLVKFEGQWSPVRHINWATPLALPSRRL